LAEKLVPKQRFLLTALLVAFSVMAVQCLAPVSKLPSPTKPEEPTPSTIEEPLPTGAEEPVLTETEEAMAELRGSQSHPVRIVFVGDGDVDPILSGAKELNRLLNKETGLFFESLVVLSYADSIEAMCAGQAEVGWFTPFSYVLAHDRCEVEVKLITLRAASEVERSQINFNIDNNPDLASLAEDPAATDSDRIAALKGKRFAFIDPASTSGYLYPAAQFYANGLDPGADFGQVVYTGSDKAAVLAVYRGDVDAGVSSVDARDTIVDVFPDVKEGVGILLVTDPIPNQTVGVRAGLPEDLKTTIGDALLEIAGTQEGMAALKSIHPMDGLVSGEDAMFEPVREIVEKIHVDPATGLPAMAP
jgi:phosphonate transport system substrate-binding protein